MNSCLIKGCELYQADLIHPLNTSAFKVLELIPDRVGAEKFVALDGDSSKTQKSTLGDSDLVASLGRYLTTVFFRMSAFTAE